MDYVGIGVDAVTILLLLVAFGLFRTPRGARLGNLLATVALGFAAIIVVTRHGLGAPGFVVAALVVGSAVGWGVAARVSMVQIPAMVAFQHGVGGVAAFLVSFAELARDGESGWSVAKASGLLGVLVGAATFSASLIAAGKLMGRLRQAPRVLPGHSLLVLGVFLAAVGMLWVVGAGGVGTLAWGGTGLLLAGVALGVIIAMRVGGADMPVLISFLNATAGVAAALCGVVIGSRLLVACGATVAASGSILTYVMCSAMNRSFLNVVVGVHVKHPNEGVPTESKSPGTVDGEGGKACTAPEMEDTRTPLERAVAVVTEAKSVIFVPGFGMALAQAQFEVMELARLLEAAGAEVKFAVHPVAGRMPGHMNVLLAEADVNYEKLIEMDEANAILPDADLSLVVGACDVVNPAARDLPDTPISGMPILDVSAAKNVVVCNLNDKPGYSGVDNTLYGRANVVCLFGDAKERVAELCGQLKG